MEGGWEVDWGGGFLSLVWLVDCGTDLSCGKQLDLSKGGNSDSWDPACSITTQRTLFWCLQSKLTGDQLYEWIYNNYLSKIKLVFNCEGSPWQTLWGGGWKRNMGKWKEKVWARVLILITDLDQNPPLLSCVLHGVTSCLCSSLLVHSTN